MTKTTKIALSMLAAGAMIMSANAIPITGTVNFTGGSITLDNPPGAGATTIEAFTGTTVVSGGATAPTGSYAGTAGATVTWAAGPIQFSPTLSPSPISPLWSFISGATYSFTLNNIHVVDNIPGFLNLAGNGVVSITGGTYTPTAGTFTLTATGTGPLSFNFTAGTTAVPESGTTAILLGLGITALVIFAKFRKTAVA